VRTAVRQRARRAQREAATAGADSLSLHIGPRLRRNGLGDDARPVPQLNCDRIAVLVAAQGPPGDRGWRNDLEEAARRLRRPSGNGCGIIATGGVARVLEHCFEPDAVRLEGSQRGWILEEQVVRA